MNVLSLFDGISGGRLALERAGIPVHQYFTSEIDKFASSVSLLHYPIQFTLGDIRNISAIDLPPIDLLIAGSPCQGFSNAGKGTNFSHSGSGLFFNFVDLLDQIQPTYFLLENVRMKAEWRDTITQYVFVEPELFDSAWFSAQRRERLYWFNWDAPPVSEYNTQCLRDIFVDRDVLYLDDLYADYKWYDCPTGSYEGFVELPGMKPGSQHSRVYYDHYKSPTLIASQRAANRIKVRDGNRIRVLNDVERERLQTFPDNWTFRGLNGKIISSTQRIKQTGNAFNVDTVAHILRGLL